MGVIHQADAATRLQQSIRGYFSNTGKVCPSFRSISMLRMKSTDIQAAALFKHNRSLYQHFPNWEMQAEQFDWNSRSDHRAVNKEESGNNWGSKEALRNSPPHHPPEEGCLLVVCFSPHYYSRELHHFSSPGYGHLDQVEFDSSLLSGLQLQYPKSLKRDINMVRKKNHYF